MRHTEKNKSKKRENEITYGNELVGVVHHGYEHVQQHNKGDDVVGPKHSGPNKFCELMSGFHVGDIEIQQTEHRPEEWLEGLEKSANKPRFLLGYLTLENGKQCLVQAVFRWGTCRHWEPGTPQSCSAQPFILPRRQSALQPQWPTGQCMWDLCHINTTCYLSESPVRILVRCNNPNCPEETQGSLAHSTHMDRTVTITSL